MASIHELIRQVRSEIGDPAQPFRSTGNGDGQTVLYDLPKQELNEGSMEVTIVSGAIQTSLTDYTRAQPWNAGIAYAPGTVVTLQGRFYACLAANTGTSPVYGGNTNWSDVTDTAYTVNKTLGKIMLGCPAPLNSILIVSGSSWSLFSDEELCTTIAHSILQHTYAQDMVERYRDAHGFIDYRETPKMLQNLPAIEEPLIVMLSVINVFWTLANDAATDSNIQTAEGTSVDRTTRYEHLMNQIQAMTGRYQDYCAQLNVGLYRWETLPVRRVSYTTGRLVPLFKSQEYDDWHWPKRLIPPVDARNEDNSGVPSPMWAGPYVGGW